LILGFIDSKAKATSSKGLSDRAIITLFAFLFITQAVILFKEFIGFAG
jgi:hypothetical protein